MRKIVLLLAVLVSFTSVSAHDISSSSAVVIDTDMGLDDAVAMALALQMDSAEISAVVACEGVASGEKGSELLARMLELFNRSDIELYSAARVEPAKPAPPFRPFAEQAVSKSLPETKSITAKPFSPDAYIVKGKKSVVWVLGPLTNLAQALKEKPAIKEGISGVVVAGFSDAKKAWNIRFDPQAAEFVQNSGLPVTFVTPGPGGKKLDSWWEKMPFVENGNSIGAAYIGTLLSEPRIRQHYMGQFTSFHDELVVLYYANHDLFASVGNMASPQDKLTICDLFARLAGEGRQHKQRVVFADRMFPDSVFQDDVKQRREQIIAKNGPDEWFAQLLMNELHEHLGAYSIIGVKMGLRAAELLNAPQHSMVVVSQCAARPPVSCLNDGVIVATGSTPGRRLFTHNPGTDGEVKVTFTYNGRIATLSVKKEYRDKVRARIKTLLKKYTLEDDGYWQGVREFGLNMWENWHRRDLFDVVISDQTQSGK